MAPKDIVLGAANALTASAIWKSTGLLQIQTKAVPVEAAKIMSIVETYHDSVRRAHGIIRREAPSMSPECALHAGVKAVSNSVGPNGLNLTLLLYWAMPRLGLSSELPAASTISRARAVAKVTKVMKQYFSQQKLRDALRCRNCPDNTDIHKVPLTSHVLVYRVHRDEWDRDLFLLLTEVMKPARYSKRTP